MLCRRIRRNVRVLIGALILASCAVQTAQRVRVWRSDEALWTAAVAVAPTTRALINLAAALARQGRWEEAHLWLHRAQPTTALEREGADRLHRFLCVTAGFCCAS